MIIAQVSRPDNPIFGYNRLPFRSDNMAENFVYDELAYPSYVFPQTSPHRLATMGTLYGMRPPDPRNCRFLDIGCGDGSNTLLHAHDLPGSTFLGVDLSAKQIEAANENKEELGLTNVEFLKKDLMDFSPEEFGKFDYIVAHGFYSWVPDFVRERLEWLYRECLSENGVGYISYNTFPGCHVRAMVWDMIRYRTRGLDSTDAKLKESAEFLYTFGKSFRHPQFKDMIAHEISNFATRRPEVIFHDDLSEMNRPFYFYEFADRMKKAGLQFLCEIPSMAVSEIEFSKGEETALVSFGGDHLEQEQYKDFLRSQRFRTSLVCRGEVALNRDSGPEVLRSFRLFTEARRANETAGLDTAEAGEFTALIGGGFTVQNPHTRAMLIAFGRVHPRSLTLDEAMIEGQKILLRSPTTEERTTAEAEVLNLVKSGIVQVQLFQPEFVSAAGEKPIANAFARWQAEHECDSLTTVTGFNLQLSNPAVVELIRLLDGTRDRAQLTREMLERYEIPDEKRRDFEEEMPKLIDIHLQELANCGMLTA